MNKIEQLEQQFLAMQAELEELKKGKLEASEEEPVKTMLPDQGRWCLDMCNFDPSETYLQFATKGDQNVFPDKETAEAYADAFRVMLELRRQPWSGQLDEVGDGWIIEQTGVWGCVGTDNPVFGVCPPFPSSFYARQAGEAVGIERIKKAYATLSTIKGNEMTHNSVMPSNSGELLVEVFYQKGHHPFVCGVVGKATIETLQSIEKDCVDNLEDIFDLGDGSYLFNAHWFAGQYGEYGQCELPPCYELDIAAFEELKEEQ